MLTGFDSEQFALQTTQIILLINNENIHRALKVLCGPSKLRDFFENTFLILFLTNSYVGKYYIFVSSASNAVLTSKLLKMNLALMT